MTYNPKLANEWTEWVETPNPEGTREREIFPYIQSWAKGRVADIGCGQGSCSSLIDDYVGIDSSIALITRAKQLYPNKSFMQGDVYNLPLDNQTFDAAMSIWVWSHLDDLETAANEMARVLKPEGRFLIITANPKTYDERKTWYKHYTIEGKLLRGDFDLGEGKALTDTTLYLHTFEDIKAAIEQSSLTIDKVGNMGDDMYLSIEGVNGLR